MADINVERKRKGGFLPLLLGLLVLAALALLLLRGCGDDGADPAVAPADTVATDTTAMMAPPAPPAGDSLGAAGAGVGAGAALPVAQVLGEVDQYAGQTVDGTATVPETPSDRGFWVESGGQRMFVVLAEPSEQLRDVDPGQTVRLTGARVMRGSEVSQLPAGVDAETRSTAQGQQVFLLVPSRGVEITAGGNTTPG